MSAHFTLYDDGTLRVEADYEANCAVCGEPVRWCLDMMSFTTGHDHRLAHARCVWLPEAFTTERRAVLPLAHPEPPQRGSESG